MVIESVLVGIEEQVLCSCDTCLSEGLSYDRKAFLMIIRLVLRSQGMPYEFTARLMIMRHDTDRSAHFVIT